MGLPGTAVWPLLFLVAVSPETLSPQTMPALKASSVTTGAPSNPTLVQAGTSVPDKSTLSKATETPSANGSTSIAPPGSIPTETRTTEAVSARPWSMTPRPENSTPPEGSDEPPTRPGKEPASHSTVTAQPAGGDGNGGDDESSVSQKPGLIAVICIFVSIVLVGTGVVLVKCWRAREPSFKKLDEVPMGSVTEGSPFARYPPK